MTATELGDVELLLQRVLPDPMGFAERVLGQLAERMGVGGAGGPGGMGGFGGMGGMGGTAAPAADSAASAGAADAPDVVVGVEATVWQASLDRNILLAAALGACECWGEDSGCEWCGGEGRPGWTAPDDASFDEYVAPVLARTRDQRPSAPSERPEEGSELDQTQQDHDAGGLRPDEHTPLQSATNGEPR